MRRGDVLVSSTGVGTLGRVAQATDDMADTTADSHVTIVRPNDDVGIEFFGEALLALESHFERLGAGATGQTELNRTRVAETPLLRPPQPLRLQFGEVVRPDKALVSVLLKLVSGELDVSQAETQVAATA